MIAKLRKEHGMTQKELANKVGITEICVKKLEEDFFSVDLPLDVLPKLAAAFNMCALDLICDLCKKHIHTNCNQLKCRN